MPAGLMRLLFSSHFTRHQSNNKPYVHLACSKFFRVLTDGMINLNEVK
uniref:Uncharacterized protein n=1 Tax=Setaria italica TaxID=4555 RepID=K3ZFQ1_SETIT